MLDHEDDHQESAPNFTGIDEPAAATPAPPATPRKTPRPSRPGQRRELPQFRVILHNDDANEIPFVVQTLLRLTPLNRMRATLVTLHAHYHGVALVLITHKERAELYHAQFKSKGLLVSIEPDA